jgi:aminopeptidase N
MKNIISYLVSLFLFSTALNGQQCSHSYTHQDTLRGTVTQERVWWNLLHYELSITVDIPNKSIKGSNIIKYKAIESHQVLQLDLQATLSLDKATQKGIELVIKHDGAAHFIELIEEQIPNSEYEITVYYSGTPTAAKHAPWDGGFTWSKDEDGKDFIATSCQGIGASIWWPCKDHMSDEPDQGMKINATIPSELTAVSNGKLVNRKNNDNNTTTFSWEVVNPINNYGVNLNIGDYLHFSEEYKGLKGNLSMDYWVLRQNIEKAKVHFKDATRMMEAFEHWFGPYPFYEDGYKIVEVPYLGMEHQSSVTYGNGYQNGYLGRDRSQTGWGLKFDFIIIHESGHEWFANNITYKDMADMWIHESFTAYSEGLFVEYFYGKEAGAEYNRGKRSLIQNECPLIAEYNVNASPSGDIYPKGANMLHTLRQVVNDDEKWRNLLIGLNKEFYHKTVTTQIMESYISKELNLDLRPFFNQYLRNTKVPTFEYRILNKKLIYRWINCNADFEMPLQITIDGKETTLDFSKRSIELETDNPTIKVNPDYYIYTLNIMGE